MKMVAMDPTTERIGPVDQAWTRHVDGRKPPVEFSPDVPHLDPFSAAFPQLTSHLPDSNFVAGHVRRALFRSSARPCG